MKNIHKIILSVVLTAILLLNTAPMNFYDVLGLNISRTGFSVNASAKEDLNASGACGDGVTYAFNADIGLLTISGEGEMNSRIFEDNQLIETVVFENGITSIGDYAFRNCLFLHKVEIPDSVTSIGRFAFYNCGLMSITLPKSITFIDDNALGFATVFLYGDTYTEQYALSQNLSYNVLSEIPEDEEYAEGEIFFNYYWKVDKATQTLTVSRKTSSSLQDNPPWLQYKEYIKHIVINEGFSEIDSNAFLYCDKAVDVSIPSNITKIRSNAFKGCASLTQITLPETLQTIGSSAFYGCSALTDINIPDAVKGFSDSVFYNCSSLKSITIPEKETVIEANTFSGCTDLTSIIIHENIEKIESKAFYNCTGLKELIMPCSVKINQSGYSFANCSNIEKITLTKGSGTMQDYGASGSSGSNTYYQYTPWYISKNSINEIILEDGITNIGSYAFCGSYKLKTISIPDTVTSIGEAAFSGCSSLTNITIPNGVTCINSSVFNGCSGLTNIAIPEDITSIGESAFSGCSNLASITIPDGIISIGKSAFSGCTSLMGIVLPRSITCIDDNVFNGCSALSSVEIHKNISGIGAGAFKGCSSVKTIELLYTVTHIGASAFEDCTNLERLTVYNRACTFDENSVDSSTTLYGFNGSTAESYASSNNISFVSMDNTHTHSFDYDCDRICNSCGYERIVNHVYDSVCDEYCNYCNEKRIAPHNDIDGNYYCDDCGACLLDIEISTTKEVFVEAGETVYLKFVPSYTGIYEYYSSSTEDTYGYVCDSEKNIILQNDSGAMYDNFFIEINLTKNQIYYLGLRYYDNTVSGTIPVTISYYDEHLSTHIEHMDSTCTMHGYDKYICDYCGEIVNTVELPFKHDYSTSITAPTCTEQGYTTYTCSLCGYSYIGDYTDALNHPNKTWRVTKNPTTTSTGLMVETCDLCGAKTGETIIPMLIPDYVTGITVSPNRLALNIGETANLTAVITPDTAENKNVIWSSSDTDVATVADGVVTAKTPGVTVIIAQSEDGGYKDFCVVRVASLTPVNGAVVDNENGLIYGITGNSSDINSYVNTVDGTMSVQYNSDVIGTGSVVNIVKDGTIVDSYKVVIFGDVDGDGWYDGQDAITVSCLANGMLTREQVGEAVWMAADCNHDGVIDQLDVDLLNQAGVLLSNVDQTKPTEELLETSAEYNKYIDLIDQYNTDVEPKKTPYQPYDSFITKIIVVLKLLFNHIFEFIARFF